MSPNRDDICSTPALGPAKEFEMPEWSDPRTSGSPFVSGGDARSIAYDAGLRSYMLSVYNYMASGVLLSGIVALFFVISGAVNALVEPEHLRPTMLGVVVSLLPIVVVLAMGVGQRRFSEAAQQALYWTFAVLMGMSLSTLSVAYSPTAIAQAFFAAAAGFAGLSLWGYVTKRDLSGWGTFLISGVWGLIGAMLLNQFAFHSRPMDFMISIVGVLVFSGLTAYDTQKIKSIYAYVAGTELQGRAAIQGALSLYLDFINMFLFILRLLGSQRN
jgi:FtsH-binding integral membrane protein